MPSAVSDKLSALKPKIVEFLDSVNMDPYEYIEHGLCHFP